MGPLIPLFLTSGDDCPGFQTQSGSLAYFLTCVILGFTSDVTPADCIEVSTAVFSIHILADVSTSSGEGSGTQTHERLCAEYSAVYR